MSKTVRAIIAGCILLIVLTAGFSLWLLMQRQSLSNENLSLQSQVSDTKSRLDEMMAKAKKSEETAKELSDKVNQKDKEKGQLQGLVDELKHKSAELDGQIQQAQTERDDWKTRVETMRQERDRLMEQLKNRPKEIVYKDRPVEAAAEVPAVADQGNEYWGQVLKQKASLQLELEKSKSDLDQIALQVADLKKQNSDLQLEIKQVTNDKEEIEHRLVKDKEELERGLARDRETYLNKIKYGEDLANNLSIELARSRNDQKFVNDHAEKYKGQNTELQDQIKQLSTTKVVLEKTIARLSDERDNMQKKLLETETLIQGRIDEIWKIKESLDQKMSENKIISSSGQMDLPPIIVNAKGAAPAPQPIAQQVLQPTMDNAAIQAQAQNDSAPVDRKAVVISVNESNNFVITDLGQDSGVKVGQTLKVYRGEKGIATLEVIQVRKDICAADIKHKNEALRIGDIVKFN